MFRALLTRRWVIADLLVRHGASVNSRGMDCQDSKAVTGVPEAASFSDPLSPGCRAYSTALRMAEVLGGQNPYGWRIRTPSRELPDELAKKIRRL